MNEQAVDQIYSFSGLHAFKMCVGDINEQGCEEIASIDIGVEKFEIALTL
jgi:hypothetical protein